MSEITTSKLAQDFKVLIDDVEGLMQATANEAGERFSEFSAGSEINVWVTGWDPAICHLLHGVERRFWERFSLKI
jgi:hypothetical protein